MISVLVKYLAGEDERNRLGGVIEVNFVVTGEKFDVLIKIEALDK